MRKVRAREGSVGSCWGDSSHVMGAGRREAQAKTNTSAAGSVSVEDSGAAVEADSEFQVIMVLDLL